MLVRVLQKDAQRTAFITLDQAVITLPFVDKLIDGDLALGARSALGLFLSARDGCHGKKGGDRRREGVRAVLRRHLILLPACT